MTAVLYNGLSRYDAALAGARRACTYEDFGFFGWYLVELVEAGARSGARDAAHDALDRLTETTEAAGTNWALGVQTRSRALLEKGGNAEKSYREAVDRLGRTRLRVEVARAHLVYGEWLRRENRRGDAREQLRTAYDMFTDFGASGYAARAVGELRATRRWRGARRPGRP
ncbi:hypothetical protein AB0A81_35160 [Streptomyces flaveolus]|uniref:Regulatory protein n=1 Tax=Streptomyces flaveolus TaxID=67297 RepID=A0ABV1VLQ3_9ACTN